MLKKKNMAMVMAGVTVATSVAPAFANHIGENEDRNYVVNKKDSAKVVEGVKEALNTKFTRVEGKVDKETVGASAYTILLNPTINAETGTIDGGTAVTNITDLQGKINNLQEGQELTVVLQDKGHQVIDGQTVNYEYKKYDKNTDILSDLADAKEKADTNAPVHDIQGKLVGAGVEIKLTSDATEDQTIILNTENDKVDFTKPIMDKEDKTKLVGFEKLPLNIETGVKHIVKVRNTNATVSSIEAEKLFDGIRLTREGRKLTEMPKGYTMTIQNVIIDPIFVGAEKASAEIVISKEGKEVEVVKVSSEESSIIAGLVSALENAVIDKEVIKVVAGDSRFETAVNVSKETHLDGAAKAVVLVGKDAVVDGLAAAPLAAAAEAPILLSNVDGVNADTEAEIARVLGNDAADKTIYVVGGTSNISVDAEEKLAKLGATVKRISGDDRYKTSLAIADELAELTKTSSRAAKPEAFVVGGKGEVDAMSIASYAASKKAPIVVVNKDEVSKEAKKLMTGKDLVIVGGESSVSTDVQDELKKIDSDIKRLSGDDRKGTNAAVINEYYTNVDQIFVAKDGYGTGISHLVDALTAAPLAGSESAPIVLATNGLSANQEEVLNTKVTGVAKVVQIGEGIAKSVVEKMVEIFNLRIYK